MILFLGSGVSLASGLPGVRDIRRKLHKIPGHARVKKLIRLLEEVDTDYLQNSAPFKSSSGRLGFTGQLFREETTYEDLFYLVYQIEINGEGRKADVTIEAFADFLRRKARGFLRGRTKHEQAIDLHRLACETKKLIEETVASLLHCRDPKGLDLVQDLAMSDLVDELNIVTLNHDTLAEQVLTANGIEFSDGFGRPDGDVRWFESAFDAGCKVRLIKPHGSINWWRQGSGKVIQPRGFAGRDSQTWTDGRGQRIRDVGATPSFLTGVSKVFSYNQGAFADHNYMLLRLLQTERLMVMSGYGWGDIPINFQLQNWLDRSRENRMVLLHRNPEELRDGS